MEIRTTAFAVLLALAAAGCNDGSARSKKLVFSAIPDRNETLLREKYAPVADYLAKKLGIEVEYLHANEYADAVEHFKNGDVQLAWFGGLTGVQARHAVEGARAIVQGAEDPNFYSFFIAHKDSGLEPSDEFPKNLAGKRFTFGSKGSTSGRLMPEYYIREHTGQAPAELFGSEPNYSDSHDATAELVQSGQFQAGAINYKTYEDRVASGKTDPNVCRVIWTTPTYPDYNFTAHPDLEKTFGAGFTEKLQRALLEMKEPNLLAAFTRSSFIEATNDDFAPIEKLARQLEFIR